MNANFVKFVSNVSCVHVFFAFVLFLAVCIQEGQAALKKTKRYKYNNQQQYHVMQFKTKENLVYFVHLKRTQKFLEALIDHLIELSLKT